MESPGSFPAWSSYLEVFSGEAAASLVPVLERVSSCLGPMEGSAPGKTLLAIFDAGPGQLGSPRIAQIAVLIALARRADEAGAAFCWGLLQEPEAPLSQGVTADGLRRLVGSRTSREATDAEIGDWRARIEERREGDDLWMIGAPRLGSPPDLPGASHLLIHDALEPGAVRVGMTLRRGLWSAGEVLLDLPEDASCVRLLRAAAPTSSRRVEPSPGTSSTPQERPARPEPQSASLSEGLVPSVESHRPSARGGLGARFGTALHRLTGRTALASRLSRAIGRHHAAYIRKMREMFESGDFDNALRHAIPLTAEAGGPRRLPLRPLAPRADLHIRPERSRPSRPWSVAELSPGLHGELRRLYRDAFHRLEGQGRIEEAAFLLAEVLHAHEEAVGFLERHGRLRLAAEVAEARDLPAGLVVRQWFLAGDRRRGLKIARRTGAFADAVTRLERSRRTAEATELRRLWAQELAGAGDYATAVDVLWPLAEERHRTVEWMDRAIAQGGAPAGRMMARKAVVAPEPFEKLRAEALAFLESWRAEGVAARLAFGDEIRRGPRTPAATTLARAAVRAIARDSGRLGARIEPADLRELVAFAGDGALRTDALALPLPAREPWILRPGPWYVEIAARDAGSMPACDAAFLPNGLTAVALGETGVRLLSRGGRVVAELDQPAHRLVVSDHGDRAIALARRGDVWRLARLDFANRRAEPWCDVRLDAFAPDYDGALWFVVGPQGLLAVETTDDGFDGSWGVSHLPGPALAIARNAGRIGEHGRCSLAFGDDEGHEVWTYELPSLTLRRRDSVPPAPEHRRSHPVGVSPEGMLAEALGGSGRRVALHIHGAMRFAVPLPGPGRPGEPVVAGDWVVLPVHTPEALVLHLVHLPSAAVRAEIALGRTTRATLRLTPQYFTLADDRGRVLVLDLENGQVRRDFRL
ncbi:MAG TPA: hypothetical protein VHC97_19545 [Thermoanaerobaculia bacterium]|jgi:hypothetical protein|nr:hypothetical protein [Thermoanaerobaculia bacterium]